VVKFQKRDLASLPESSHSKPRTDDHAYGPTEYEHRKALEFSLDQHADLKSTCSKLGVTYGCSAWDPVSAEELLDMGVSYLKIPSAKNQEFHRWKVRGLTVPTHVSLGMLSGEERDAILRRAGSAHMDMVPYACTSKYPSDHKDVYLGEIPYLRTRFEEVGFSGHHKGIALDIAAFVLGATWIERHFTMDRTWKGTDHAASLDPTGLRRVVRDLQAVAEAWKPKPGGLPEGEVGCRAKFKPREAA